MYLEGLAIDRPSLILDALIELSKETLLGIPIGLTGIDLVIGGKAPATFVKKEANNGAVI